MKVIAIDPGTKGGVACISMDGAGLTLHEVIDMPDLNTVKGYNKLMNLLKEQAPDALILEVQRCRGGNSALATWNHARHYGRLETCILLSYGKEPCMVEPTVWMHTVKDMVGDPVVSGLEVTKARTWTLSHTLFPGVIMVGPRGRKKDGMADAICLGWYYLKHVLGD